MTLANHLFSSDDGALYDTRAPGWSAHPIRRNYRQSHSVIETLADIKAALRAGEYTWPGAYPLFFVASDGEALSFESVRECWREVCRAHLDNDRFSGWHISGCDVNYEDADLTCAHSGEPIGCAYPPD
jgi:hypothetical protein